MQASDIAVPLMHVPHANVPLDSSDSEVCISPKLSYLRELEAFRRFQEELECHQANELAADSEAAWLRGEISRLLRRERESGDRAAQVDPL
jgi:hypothetical protein